MYLVREVFHCKPGKAGEIVKRFKQLQPYMAEVGFKEPQRVMTDMSGAQYWTVIVEQPVCTLEQYLDLTRQTMTDPRVQKIMQGYHDIVESGKREIYKIE
jgi:hypothetical protein